MYRVFGIYSHTFTGIRRYWYSHSIHKYSHGIREVFTHIRTHSHAIAPPQPRPTPRDPAAIHHQGASAERHGAATRLETVLTCCMPPRRATVGAGKPPVAPPQPPSEEAKCDRSTTSAAPNPTRPRCHAAADVSWIACSVWRRRQSTLAAAWRARGGHLLLQPAHRPGYR